MKLLLVVLFLLISAPLFANEAPCPYSLTARLEEEWTKLGEPAWFESACSSGCKTYESEVKATLELRYKVHPSIYAVGRWSQYLETHRPQFAVGLEARIK